MPKVEGEQKYFTAQEAREVSNKIQNEQMNQELDEIYKKINDARFEGKTSINVNYIIMTKTEEFLLNKGFLVKIYNGYESEPPNTIISW